MSLSKGVRQDEGELPLLNNHPFVEDVRRSSSSTSTLHAPIPRYPHAVPPPISTHFPPSRPDPIPTPSTTTLPSYLTHLPLSLPTKHIIHANTGLLLVASSQIFFVCMALTAKFFVTTTSISSFTLIFVRMGITALLSISWLTYSGNPHPILGPPDPTVRRLLILRGFFGFGGLFSNYQSLRGLSVSDSTTIQFLAPNLTAALGWLVLGEIMGWREVTAGLLCLGGVVLVSRPPFIFGVAAESGGGGGGGIDGVGGGNRGTGGSGGGVIPPGGIDAGITPGQRLMAVGWCFVSLTFATCAYITIRKIGKQAHAMHSMLYFCYACLITSSIGLLIEINSFVFIQSWKEFWLIMLIGGFGFIAQILLTFGLQREKAGRASLAMYLSLFYSLIFELVIFGTVPPILSLLGAGIIIGSAIWVALSKKTESNSSSGTYQRLEADEEESLPFSRTPSPLPATGGRRGETYDYSTGVTNGTMKDSDGKKEEQYLGSNDFDDGSIHQTGGGLVVDGRSLLRRKSSTGSVSLSEVRGNISGLAGRSNSKELKATM